jgi:hypothetical protein
LIAEPVARRARNGRDIGNSAAASRDSNVAARHFEPQRIELLAHCRADIGERI